MTDAATRHPAFVMVRVAICVLITSTTAQLAWLAPSSLTARLLNTDGFASTAILWGLTMFAVAGIADIICNDLTPRQSWISINALRRGRTVGYMGIGALYMAQAGAGLLLFPPGAWVLILNYLLVGLYCGAYVTLEIREQTSAILALVEGGRP